jgi:aminoglycoside phosphotransferase family enzyme/adenylate kinase family enzyme
MTVQTRLIDGLKRALERRGLEVIVRETHISWVLLAGDRAWKLKKAVNFGFLDFSTLAKRKYACEEELRLNSRFAPEIYLDVIHIGGTASKPVFNGKTAAIEYAVCMLRFDERGLLSNLADGQQLDQAHIDAMAQQIANIHQHAPPAEPDSLWGKPDRVHHWLSETLIHIKRLIKSPEIPQATNVDQLCTRLYAQLRSILKARNESGFIRECHGDLHLGNMVWIESKLVPFDCIEFNPGLRWIDVISEAAFVMMDLDNRHYPAFAWRFINRYLSITGDYASLKVLRYYIVYRALVRAKVALLQHNEAETLQTKKTQLYAQYIAYADLAERWLTQSRPVLILMHGLSASGKSTIAVKLAEEHGCIHLRSDVERKRLHELDPMADSVSGTNSGIYTASASNKTYLRLSDLATIALNSGYPVIIDAAFLERKRRNHFQQLAIESACPFLIVHCEASRDILEARIIARAQRGDDPSEATLAVLNKQIEQQHTLARGEPHIKVSDTTNPVLPPAIIDQLHP